MSYEKRVVVLKEEGKGFSADGSAVSGVVYAERMGEEITLKVQTAALAPVKEGQYVLVFGIGSELHCFQLKEEALKIPSAPALSEGFSALIAFVRGEAYPVAYGSCGSAPFSCRQLLSAVTAAGRVYKKKEAGEENAPFPQTSGSAPFCAPKGVP